MARLNMPGVATTKTESRQRVVVFAFNTKRDTTTAAP